MKIGIIGAMEEEITLLRNKIDQCQMIERAGYEIYTGKLHNMDVALLKSGIGKVSAAVGTALLIEQCAPDLIINTGSAGGLAHTLKIGDIVVSTEVCYHDVDVTSFGYHPGQMAGAPAVFTADPELIALAEQCIQQLKFHAVPGLICSGDAFINGGDALTHIRTLFPQACAVEMEAAAIAHTCYRFNLPFVVVRAISDVADQVSHMSFDDFLATAAQQSSLLIESMLQCLAKNKSC